MALRVRKKGSFRRQMTPQRMAAAERRKASLRRLAVGTVILVLLAFAGGGGYTWYKGQQKAPIAAAATPAPSRRIEVKPAQEDPNANVGVSVQMATSPLQPGQNASISIRTNQLATCTITVLYGAIPATDSGLIKKAADEYGTVSWSWTVAPTAPEGKATAKVDCANKLKSGSATADLLVKK